MKSKTTLLQMATLAAAMSLSLSALATDITGAGATFPYAVYTKWAEAYKAATGNTVNYQGIGSGGGIKQIKAKTVDFAGTDAPLSVAELDQANLVQFPGVIGHYRASLRRFRHHLRVQQLPGEAVGCLQA